LIAPGAQVEVRHEEWLVRTTQQTPSDGLLVRCIGSSTLVRDTEAAFLTKLDVITRLGPDETQLVADDSPNFRTSRLYLEAVLRKTRLAATNTDLAVSQHQLLNRLVRYSLTDRAHVRRCLRTVASEPITSARQSQI